jgi:hypothetical protein
MAGPLQCWLEEQVGRTEPDIVGRTQGPATRDSMTLAQALELAF